MWHRINLSPMQYQMARKYLFSQLCSHIFGLSLAFVYVQLENGGHARIWAIFCEVTPFTNVTLMRTCTCRGALSQISTPNQHEFNKTYSGLGCDCLRTAEYRTAIVTALERLNAISFTSITRTNTMVPYVSFPWRATFRYVPS